MHLQKKLLIVLVDHFNPATCYLPLTLTKDNFNCQLQFALDDRICLLLCLTVNTLPLSGGNT